MPIALKLRIASSDTREMYSRVQIYKIRRRCETFIPGLKPTELCECMLMEIIEIKNLSCY
jgi:hypothetical protein